jgi:hypothetical protein
VDVDDTKRYGAIVRIRIATKFGMYNAIKNDCRQK